MLVGIGGANVPLANSAVPTTQTRTYYIAADEVHWNYAPHGKNDDHRRSRSATTANVFVEHGRRPDRHHVHEVAVPGVHRRLVHARSSRGRAAWEHLGFLGPVIRAEVGDTIKIVFKNNLHRPVQHPHARRALRQGLRGRAVRRRHHRRAARATTPSRRATTYTYDYKVPERAGPGPMDGSSVMWMYHSHTDEVGDTYSGLVGPMVITRGRHGPAGRHARATSTARSSRVFQVTTRTRAWYLRRRTWQARRPTRPVTRTTRTSASRNLMHSINGYVYGNQPLARSARMTASGEHVRWYLMGMGTEVDLHTPHWHGNTVTPTGMRTDVVELLPAQMVTADMTPDDPGIWLFHCHVNDHIPAGMITRYQVAP